MDGVIVQCIFKTKVTNVGVATETETVKAQVPENGIWLWKAKHQAVIVSGTGTSRDMRSMDHGSQAKTYIFPLTIVVVNYKAFTNRKALQLVQLNENLRMLYDRCFEKAGIRRLVLPQNVWDIRPNVFWQCDSLQYVNLKNAVCLKRLEYGVFSKCKKL